MKILVIEDEPASLKLAHLVLSCAGHDVSDAEAAERAVQLIRKDKPDAILLDMELPGMDGLTLVRNLKANPETRDIPIVAVTGYPERWTRELALKAGCHAYLVKPINTRALPQQIAEVVSKEADPQI
jgi:CheY-like chemotaxis protein